MQRDEVLTDRLQKHVERLGGDIGERNVFVPDALESAAQYIEDEWREQGYTVERLEYDVFGIRCANLTATRGGSARQTEILLLGAHYDSVMGSPGANDNASRSPRMNGLICWSREHTGILASASGCSAA